MRRTFFFAALLVFLLACFACAAAEETDWQYEIIDRSGADPGVRIKRYNPAGDPPEILEVPETLGGYPVKELSSYVFATYRELDNHQIETMTGSKVIVLPAEISKIGPDCFRFRELQEIRIENGLFYETVDGVLFHKQTHTLVAYPRGKKNSLYVVPEGTQVIGEHAFDTPENLSEVRLAESVRVIEKDAFCVFYLKLAIPEKVETIEPGAVIWASRFTSSSPRYRVTNGLLIDSEEKRLISVPYSPAGENNETRIISIPEGVEIIGEKAFYDVSCYEVNYPSTLKSIEDWNQYDQLGSGTLVFPENLESVGCNVRIWNLKALVFPSSLRSIGEYSFSYGDTLETVVFREGLAFIGYNSFFRNQNLTTVVFPDSLKRIGRVSYTSLLDMEAAFDECPMLHAFVMPGSTAEAFCLKHSIPYHYTFEGRWQVDPAEAEEVLSLPGADQVMIRLERRSLELSYIQGYFPRTERFSIEWKDGHLCMEGGYMDYDFPDEEHLILKLNEKQLHLTKTEESV